MYGYGGYGFDDFDDGGVAKDDPIPPIVKNADEGKLANIKKQVTTAKNKGDKALRLCVNKTQRWTEVAYKSCYTKEFEWHGLTALATASRKGHVEIVHFLLLNGADPTLEGCWTDDEYANAYKAQTLCKDGDKSARIKALLDAVKPFWNDAKYKSSSYSKDRVKKSFPNEPTDSEGLQNMLTSFPGFTAQKQARPKKPLAEQRPNMPAAAEQQAPQQVQKVPSHAVQGQESLTATILEQKQVLGERLFPLISSMYPDLAGKITGMLLELDNSELLHMLESRESLKAKVEEAVVVLQAHQV